MKYRVRATLTDGSQINAGGFKALDAARAAADRWISPEVFKTRVRNGALPVLSAIVIDPAGQVVSGHLAPAGMAPRTSV